MAVLVAVLVPMTWAGWGAARDAVLQTSEVRADEDIDRLDRLDPSVG